MKRTSLLLLGVMLNLFVFAQETGIFLGSIKNEDNGQVLVGASISILETLKKTSSDVNGNYTLAGIEPGTYTVEYSYLGFERKQIEEVEIQKGKITTLNVVLARGNAKELDEVVVRGSYKKESLNALYAQQKNSVSISDGISAEVIKRSPDRNTGEVLKRISGASIQDDKFVIVRGLNDRYNTALLNSSPLPSTEPDRKAFSFDIIPSSLIDNVVISKTATADLPGDFSGGAIQVRTKDFPNSRVFDINVGLGYNSLSTSKTFLGRRKNVGNYFGFVNSDHDLPAGFPATSALYSDLNAAEKVAMTKKFKNTWGVSDLGKAIPSQSLGLVYGDSYGLRNGGKIGFITSVNFRSAQNIKEEVRQDVDATVVEGEKARQYFSYVDNNYEFSSSLGGLANVSYIKDRFKLSLKNIFNQVLEDDYMLREGNYDGTYYRKASMQEVNQKRMLNSVLDGEYAFVKSRLDWNLSFSRIANDQPDLRRLTYQKPLEDKDDGAVPFRANIPMVATASTSGRFYSNLGENIYNSAVNYSMPVRLLNQDQTVKVGLGKQYKDRKFNSRVLGYVDRGAHESLFLMDQGELFAAANIATNKFYIEDITNPTNSYKGTGDLTLGYAMISGKVVDNFKANVGLRVENYAEKLTSGNVKNVDNKYLDFLPSLNLTYELTPKANVRFSYSSTVARAQFRELAPFSFYNFVSTAIEIGNPDLERTKVMNFDLRYEYYPAAGMLLTGSAFYKKMDDAIEKTIQSGSTPASKTITYINAPDAYITGLELEVRHNLGFVQEESELLGNLFLYANLAYIKSEVDLSNANLDVKAVNQKKRNLQGQSPYLVNLGLQQTFAAGWGANVMYNKIGRRIDVVGFGHYDGDTYFAEYPDIYEAPRNLLDAQVSKSFLNHKAEFKLNASNILNASSIFYQDIDGSKKYNAEKDQLINSVKYGRSFSLSFSYKF